MAILWCGQEDLDFPNGYPITDGASPEPRVSGYSRDSLVTFSGSAAYSSTFSGITSGWLTFRYYGTFSGTPLNLKTIGFVDSSTKKGLYICIGNSTAAPIAVVLGTWDGSSVTQLAVSATRPISINTPYRFDIKLTNYGAVSTIDVYLDGSLIIEFSGDSSISGVTNFDCIGAYGSATNYVYFTEMILADQDTRTMRLVTLYPTADGDTQDWGTGSYDSVDEWAINDADVLNTNTADLDAQLALSNLPAGTFYVHAVKIAARASKSNDASVATLELGVKHGGTVNVDAGQTLVTAWQTKERLMTTNPVTAAAWTQADVDALQLVMQSET